jgi:hypothetical protein
MRIKKLDRTTTCTLFPIRYPQWNGGKPHVGLNISRLTPHNEITIDYTRKSDGQKTWPDTYYYDNTNRDRYEVQNWKGVELLLVPIADLYILQRVSEAPEDTLEEWLDDDRYAKTKEELDKQKSA